MKINNHDHGKFTAPGEIRFQRLLPGSIERAWAYLTDPEKRGRWLAAGPMELRVGGPVTLQWNHAAITPHQESVPDKYKEMCARGADTHGRVTRCEPPKVLAYTWEEGEGKFSEVTFELTAQAGKTLLVLTHRKLGDNRNALLSVAAGWHTHIAIMLAKLEGAAPPPFWSTHSQLEAEYEKQLNEAAR